MEQKQNANLPSTAMRSLHGEGQKLKKTYILRRLWRYFKEYKWLLALAIFLTLAGNALALVGPKLSGLAIDAIEPGPGKWTLPPCSIMRNTWLCSMRFRPA